jgi:tetratricopeptide (TPR) repeat protein
LADLGGAADVFKSGGPSFRWADSIVGGFRVEQTYLLCEAGDLEGAIARAKQSIADDPRSTRSYHVLVRVYLRAGKAADAERALADLRKVKEGNKNPSDAFFELLAVAELETFRGNKQAAMDAFTRMDALPIEARYPWVQWRTEGDVKAALGDASGAADAYRKFLDSRELLMFGFNSMVVERITVLFSLAQAEEASGRFAEARRYHQAYLDRWGDADIEIPNVAESRRRLGALKGR